ncbi:MAG: regulatory protein RecX [Betaproteobacteria bacterium]|nr:MAG: regulatory protein RecX [Betaproteobacteria bacterium]
MKSKPDSAADLNKRAVRLLARRDRSRSEMQRLLAPHCADAHTVSALLDDLQARGWLSERRLAEQLIDSRRSRASAARIRQEMARRGLADAIIAIATAGLDAHDVATALALWRKRFRELAADRTERERQLRFLLNRGFSQAVALKVLRIAGANDTIEFEE